MDFHISRQARDRYQFDQGIYSLTGDAILADFQAARQFAQRINQTRDLATNPEQAVQPGEINALGLLHEILHLVIRLYRTQRNSQAFGKALNAVHEALGEAGTDEILLDFIQQFPPPAVYAKKSSPLAYLEGSSEGIPNREVVLEEVLLLWLENRNPACQPFAELFNEKYLETHVQYARLMEVLAAFFRTQPRFGPQDQDLITLLRSPALASPYSLSGQMEYVQQHWVEILGTYLYRLLTGQDWIREEHKPSFSGPGPTRIPVYHPGGNEQEIRRAFGKRTGEEELAGFASEPEAFSADQYWMPRLVLQAKNAYVWLAQLSKQYGQNCRLLSDVPDEELRELSSRGVTGLWLIGLWERSRASATIKRLCGNPEALASAYSLFEYQIAEDLGGEAAYRNLRDRAWRFGIRLASDMVPNHMGIDSPWLSHHPEWFIQSTHPPFPSYTFNGPDLSADPGATIQIEDHYFDRTDAAVVFRFDDHRNGEVRFIYHGNDGTSMPWNDTAQLNYLLPEVREAVIQTILSVARRFPIIRFDAAMTLAKRHFQRLWYPDPGTGGAIPSRAEYGMSKEQFNTVFPQEFWREVVDRIAVEAPDTLLLAEAFWMMEGYFVRTLGMHRVYNSAFMHMLRNEENAKYRALIQNTLEFEPEILKRYVNFMNNPDEETAVAQFGKGDKYFGTCVMMATLPGLPMLGHGQVEGYAEKYGMEYRQAYKDESPDEPLVDYHRHLIFPLLRDRALYAEVENFHLFNFHDPSGAVNENVFAYSNRFAERSVLVVFNNNMTSAYGTVWQANKRLARNPDGSRSLHSAELSGALGLSPAEDSYISWRDAVSNLEYLCPAKDILARGMQFHLHGYEHHVLLDWHVLPEEDRDACANLHQVLGNRGVPSLRETLKEMALQQVQSPFRDICNPGYLQYLQEQVQEHSNTPQLNSEKNLPALLDEAVSKLDGLLTGITSLTGLAARKSEIRENLRSDLHSWIHFPEWAASWPGPAGSPNRSYLAEQFGQAAQIRNQTPVAVLWFFLRNLGKLATAGDPGETSRAWLDEWRLVVTIEETFRQMGMSEDENRQAVAALRMLVSQAPQDPAPEAENPRLALQNWLANEDVRRFLGVNRFQEILWFNRDAMVGLSWWRSANDLLAANREDLTAASLLIQSVRERHLALERASAKAEYQLEEMLRLLDEGS